MKIETLLSRNQGLTHCHKVCQVVCKMLSSTGMLGTLVGPSHMLGLQYFKLATDSGVSIIVFKLI